MFFEGTSSVNVLQNAEMVATVVQYSMYCTVHCTVHDYSLLIIYLATHYLLYAQAVVLHAPELE